MAMPPAKTAYGKPAITPKNKGIKYSEPTILAQRSPADAISGAYDSFDGIVFTNVIATVTPVSAVIVFYGH